MKHTFIISLFLALLLMLCKDPTSPSQDILEEMYGNSVIEIPGIALSKIASNNIMYNFELSISGPQMKKMSFKWPLDGSGATFEVNRIPAGPSRLFEGILSGTDGSTYEGKAYANISGGKTAHVVLILRKTGSANVEVIIEDFQYDSLLVGCYGLKGKINEVGIYNYTLDILNNNNGKFYGIIKEKNKQVGKITGVESNSTIEADFFLPPVSKNPLFLRASKSSNGKSFKGFVYLLKESVPIGSMVGNSIHCDIPPDKVKLVIFDSQGADKDADPDTILVKPPETTIGNLPTPPVKDGYTFTGWFTEVNGVRVSFNEQFKVTENITVYASWVNNNTSSFVVWAEGSGCDRELQFRALDEELQLTGNNEIAVKKGVGADFFVVISYDGVWIAFSRTIDRYAGRYGECDYHEYDKQDIYVAKIDNGKNLPAEAIKVDHGYWPSWGMDDNAKDPSQPKLLYYTRYDDQTIRKALINPDGTIAYKDVLHATCPKKMQGTAAHTQGSPDGKFILYRPGKMKVYSVDLGKDISGDLGGQHPSWGPRSKYFIRSKNGVFLNTGTSVKSLGSAGVGSYWQGFSNDDYFDEGKLWIIGRIGGTGQNVGAPIEFKEVDISNGGWKYGIGTKVTEEGTSCDIHVSKP